MSRRRAARIAAGIIVRVAVYTRISVEELEDDDPSCEDQYEEIVEALDDEYGIGGWELVEHYSDPDRSAFKENVTRTDFERMLNDGARRLKFDVCAVWATDRLTRSSKTGQRILALWHDERDAERCVSVFTVMGQLYDLSKAEDVQHFETAVSASKFESARKRERLLRYDRKAVKRGWAPTSACEGYERESFGRKRGGTLHVVESEAKALLVAEQLLVVDGLSMSKAAQRLNALGFRRRSGIEWSGPLLAKTLLSPTIAGLIERRGVYSEGNWDAIIPPARWHALRAVLSDPARKKKTPTATYWAVLHDENGLVLVGGRQCVDDKSREMRRVYRSPVKLVKQLRKSWHPPLRWPTHVTIDAAHVEKHLLDVFAAFIDSDGFTLPDEVELDDELSDEELLVESIKDELRKLSRWRREGKLHDFEFFEQRDPLAEQLAEAQRNVSERVPRLGLKADDVKRLWRQHVANDDVRAQQQLVVMVLARVGRVVVLPAGGGRYAREQLPRRLVFVPRPGSDREASDPLTGHAERHTAPTAHPMR